MSIIPLDDRRYVIKNAFVSYLKIAPTEKDYNTWLTLMNENEFKNEKEFIDYFVKSDDFSVLYINMMFKKLLGRDATTDELTKCREYTSSGNFEGIFDYISGTSEYFVVKIYEQYLSRFPENGSSNDDVVELTMLLKYVMNVNDKIDIKKISREN